MPPRLEQRGKNIVLLDDNDNAVAQWGPEAGDVARETFQGLPLDGIGRLPVAMTSPPTVALSAANAATSIASSILIGSDEPNCFTFIGGQPKLGSAYPDYQGVSMLGVYPATSGPPWAAEFVLDTADATGRFELVVKGSGGKYRLLCWQNGQWAYATAAATFTPPADGNQYRGLVTMGAAGIYRLRVEFEAQARLYGVQVAPTDSLSATHKRRPWIAVGDSFTEPTITDSGASITSQGWPSLLGYMTGWDIWCAGKGATGYLNPGASVKFRDRLGELLSFGPYGMFWAGGLNDSAYTYTQLRAEVLACIDAAQQGGVPCERQIVLSPFWRGNYSTVISSLLVARDAIKDAALLRGCPFIDVIAPDPYLPPGPQTGSLAAAASASATSISCSIPVPPNQNLIGTAYCVLIGNTGASNLELRLVTGISGSGPYTLSVAALANAHAAGEQVRQVGQPIWTGTGRQGATAGNGNSDRYVGNDSTHPTVAGHSYIAREVFKQLAPVLMASGQLT